MIVVGGSLGGLSAAVWLRDLGCDVEVFERAPVFLEDRGAGIMLNPATVRYFLDQESNRCKADQRPRSAASST
jgi:2,6-dihydroxypyridine 3-monooxygenase